MAQQQPQNPTPPDRSKEGITRITVGGFKSIVEEQSIEVRPLTILAGANSSGKSSIMQPLLLLKQTLEAPYDPGALLLNGPNVRFTLVDQLLSRMGNGQVVDSFHVEIEAGTDVAAKTAFRKNKGFDLEETTYRFGKKEYHLYINMPREEFLEALNEALPETFGSTSLAQVGERTGQQHWIGELKQNRSFLELVVTPEVAEASKLTIKDDYMMWILMPMPGEMIVKNYIRQTIHLPGLSRV